jgi:hypothetical protein
MESDNMNLIRGKQMIALYNQETTARNRSGYQVPQRNVLMPHELEEQPNNYMKKRVEDANRQTLDMASRGTGLARGSFNRATLQTEETDFKPCKKTIHVTETEQIDRRAGRQGVLPASTANPILQDKCSYEPQPVKTRGTGDFQNPST